MHGKFHIVGRRWFQKTYGNTYNSVTIIDTSTGERIARLPFNYGYGDHYLTIGLEWLVSNGHIPDGDHKNGLGWSHAKSHDVTYQVEDVQRKKDL